MNSIFFIEDQLMRTIFPGSRIFSNLRFYVHFNILSSYQYEVARSSIVLMLLYVMASACYCSWILFSVHHLWLHLLFIICRLKYTPTWNSRQTGSFQYCFRLVFILDLQFCFCIESISMLVVGILIYWRTVSCN